jgi:putative hydrolase of the HAD superfamily
MTHPPADVRRPRAVIFDRDGVLTHFDLPMLKQVLGRLVPLPLDAIAMRWQRWCERGGPRTESEEASFFRGFWDSVADEVGLADPLREELHAFDYTRAVRAFPEARATLLAARAHGLKVGVLSNFPLVSLGASLDAAGLADVVDAAHSAATIGASKPHPASYLTVTRALGVEPEECLFFDDEAECVEGARALGIEAYLVDRARDAHALAEWVVRDLEVVPALLAPTAQRGEPRR